MKFAIARWSIVAACMVGVDAGTAQPAGDYPNRAVRLIVPQAAGGGLDSSTRLIATRLADNLGHGVVIENRLMKQGYEIHASTPEEYGAYMKNEIGRWTPIVKAAGIKME